MRGFEVSLASHLTIEDAQRRCWSPSVEKQLQQTSVPGTPVNHVGEMLPW